MSENKPTVLVTGVSGNLGLRLLPQLSGSEVVGVDLRPPATSLPLRFESMDLGQEESCRRMVEVLKETGAQAVVHLAFVIDQVRTGVLDLDRMWRINVPGTARVMEAIAHVNRHGGAVRKFVFLSSVSAYGSDLPHAVREDFPLGGHTLPYAIHKRESDEVAQARAASLGECSTYILRPHIFAGASVQNYLIGGFRGTPTGKGRLAARLRARGSRLPFVLPVGERYLQTRFQFVHVDDVARLIAWILRRPESGPAMNILNVAGRGPALPLLRCLEMAGTRALRVPGMRGCRLVLDLMWRLGVCAVPPEAVPYITGTYVMDTTRLQQLLGSDYEDVIRYTVEQALEDGFSVPASGVEPRVALPQSADR